MPLPLAFHKIDNRFEWGFTRNTVPGFRRIVNSLEKRRFCCDNELFEISFDDGYTSIYENAFPILEKTSLRAIVFIITDFIGKDSCWDIYPGACRFYHLDKTQIRSLAEAGFKIGSHTVTHRNLCRLDNGNLRSELEDSRKILEDICGFPVETISYPFGRYDKRVAETALECGYKYGYTFFKNHDDEMPDGLIQNLIRERIPVYLFDTPLSVLLKLGSLRSFENLKGRIIKSYNIFTDMLTGNR
ncbi:MAG: polysaccharide deacetylase family protein [candidate division Zixibacteria bacterium]|nr:polysaccharide deacetylase family protein [candidate division Zixibacteria bacterium]